jgi:modulator of FtsH protease HflC
VIGRIKPQRETNDPPARDETPDMKKTLRWTIVVAAVAALAGVAISSTVAVDETEFAVVTSFGRIAAVYGDGPAESGLHPKAPWQLAIKIDRRLRVFDPPPREVMTGDKRNLEVAPYVVWRVADPVVFLRGSGSHELAEARLNERISAGLSDAIGRRDLASLASTDAGKWALDDLTREVVQTVASPARDELGVEVIDVRLRRFGHPLEVRPAVFDLIRSERRQVAARLRAEGEAQYLTITSQADRSRDTILAEAEAEARRIRGNAEAEATRLLNEAHARDPRFYELLRTLEAYRSILDERATVVLTASSPLLKLLVHGPTSVAPNGPTASQARDAGGASGMPSINNAARQP